MEYLCQYAQSVMTVDATSELTVSEHQGREPVKTLASVPSRASSNR